MAEADQAVLPPPDTWASWVGRYRMDFYKREAVSVQIDPNIPGLVFLGTIKASNNFCKRLIDLLVVGLRGVGHGQNPDHGLIAFYADPAAEGPQGMLDAGLLPLDDAKVIKGLLRVGNVLFAGGDSGWVRQRMD